MRDTRTFRLAIVGAATTAIVGAVWSLAQHGTAGESSAKMASLYLHTEGFAITGDFVQGSMSFGGYSLHDLLSPASPQTGLPPVRFKGDAYKTEVLEGAEGEVGRISAVDGEGTPVSATDPSGKEVRLRCDVADGQPLPIRRTADGDRALVIEGKGATCVLPAEKSGAPDWIGALPGGSKVEWWTIDGRDYCRSLGDGHIEFAVPEGQSGLSMFAVALNPGACGYRYDLTKHTRTWFRHHADAGMKYGPAEHYAAGAGDG